LKVPTNTLNVIVRHGLKKQGSGDGVESDCVEKATIALSLSDHVTENENGTSILKDRDCCCDCSGAQAVNVYAAAHCLNYVSPHQHQPSPAAAVAAPPPPPPQQPLQQPPPQHAPGVFPTPTEVQAASWAADLIDNALDSQFNADWQDVTTLLRLPSWSTSILTRGGCAS